MPFSREFPLRKKIDDTSRENELFSERVFRVFSYLANFKYPAKVRKLVYTTNAIENFNRRLRKATKSKFVIPTDDVLLKMLYLSMMDITKSRPAGGTAGVKLTPKSRFFLADRIPNNRSRPSRINKWPHVASLDMPAGSI